MTDNLAGKPQTSLANDRQSFKQITNITSLYGKKWDKLYLSAEEISLQYLQLWEILDKEQNLIRQKGSSEELEYNQYWQARREFPYHFTSE